MKCCICGKSEAELKERVNSINEAINILKEQKRALKEKIQTDKNIDTKERGHIGNRIKTINEDLKYLNYYQQEFNKTNLVNFNFWGELPFEGVELAEEKAIEIIGKNTAEQCFNMETEKSEKIYMEICGNCAKIFEERLNGIIDSELRIIRGNLGILFNHIQNKISDNKKIDIDKIFIERMKLFFSYINDTIINTNSSIKIKPLENINPDFFSDLKHDDEVVEIQWRWEEPVSNDIVTSEDEDWEW
jgi:hypothetical protein